MLTNPAAIVADEKGFVSSMTCDVMKLGEPDASGRCRPQPTGEQITLDVDTVIVAVGTSPNPLLRMTTPGLDTDRRGCITTQDGVTTRPRSVFAGGDAVTRSRPLFLLWALAVKLPKRLMLIAAKRVMPRHNYIIHRN